MRTYKPVPVAAATMMAVEYSKDIVVITSFDRENNLIHTTTWGNAVADKVAAARIGSECARAIGADLSLKKNYEKLPDDLFLPGEYVFWKKGGIAVRYIGPTVAGNHFIYITVAKMTKSVKTGDLRRLGE